MTIPRVLIVMQWLMSVNCMKEEMKREEMIEED